MHEQSNSYVRVQHSWLAAIEKNVLLSFAKSLPGWVKPDHLTMLGIAGSLLSGIGFVMSNRSPVFLWLVVAGLVVNWFGDSLDGNLARLRGIERPRYGFFVDHTSDILSQVFVFMGMAASPYVHFETGCILLMSYWLASMFTFIRTISSKVFQISYFGIGPTEIRLGLVAYVFSLFLVGPLSMNIGPDVVSVMDLLSIFIFVAVIMSFVIMTFMEARRLGALEPASLVAVDSDKTYAIPAALIFPDTVAGRSLG